MTKTALLVIFTGLMATPLIAGDHASSFSSMIIRKYDQNDDKKLNADEYPDRYQQYFAKTDANRDGYVDAAELATQMVEARAQWREKMQQRAEEQRTRKLQQLVEKAFAGDANEDEKLNADEASAVIKRSFGEVDTNSDGYLVRDEVERAFGLEPQAAMNIVETAAEAAKFQTLLKAAEAAGLADALRGEGPFTLFAPTDEAFANVSQDDLAALLEDKEKLAAVLKYHVVSGKVLAKDVVKLSSAETLQGTAVEISASDGGVRIDNAKIITTDIRCSNGVIHVIDTVLLPKSHEKTVDVVKSAGDEPVPLKTVVETAVDAGSFDTLVTAVKAAGLVEALSGDRSLTVFAPTDEAFAKIPTDTLQDILADKEKLTAILTYHVVRGKYLSKDVVRIDWAKTLQGSAIDVTSSKEGVKVNDAKVIQTDILCSNGVIHVIDSVLLPESLQTPSRSDNVLLPFGSGDFEDTWVTVNDGVMGGVSEGKVRLSDDNTLEFYGNLSLRNNGGFASVRSMPQELNVEDGSVLVARVRGDGREYFVNLYEPGYNMAFSYRAPIKTVEGEWTEVRVPLEDFYATSFGRRVQAKDLNPAKVNSIGFLLSDKQAGPFRLEVESIRIEKN